jgi:hypothetical protein
MNDLVTLALAKALATQTKNVELDAGRHTIDATVTLRVTGEVVKGKDVPYTPTVDIPLIPTLALVLEKAGFQRERAKALLVEAMTEALSKGDKGAVTVTERVKDIEAALAHVREVTAALPQKVRAGATTAKVVVEYVESERVAEALIQPPLD